MPIPALHDSTDDGPAQAGWAKPPSLTPQREGHVVTAIEYYLTSPCASFSSTPCMVRTVCIKSEMP